MKRLIFLLIILLIVPMGFEAATYVTTDQYATISSQVADSAYHASNSADSVHIRVNFKGSLCFSAWYNAGDAEADSSDGVLSWFDQYGDIDADSGNGTYQITASFYDASLGLYEHKYQWFILGVDMADLAIVKDTGQASKDLLDDRENWNLAGRDKIGDTIARAAAVPSDAMTLTPEERAAIEDTVYAQRTDYMADVSALAYFDTLIYIGPRGLGIYIDSSAANTNTVLGTDGTVKNPVSTLVAARTLSDALGSKRYYFLKSSTFLDDINDLDISNINYEFIGIGWGNAMAFGGQRVDFSYFENMTLSGDMHPSGGDVLYERCIIGFIESNFNGHANNCWLIDTIVAKNGRDLTFSHCQSGVPGNSTPTIDLSGGQSSINMRHYSGGIRIKNGSDNDTISVETDGQVIIDASNTSLTITLRGNMTLTDNGTTTNLTTDAVFSRQESGQWVPTDTNKSGEVLGTMPDDWDAADSAGFQGPASGLTLEQIDSILSANHGIGSWLTGGTGSGPLSFTIYAEDSTANDTLSDIPIFLFNQAGTETYGGTTDVTGSVTFNVTAGTWLARAALSSTMWAFDDTSYTVSLDFDSVAILGYPLVIPTPSNPDLGAVYGYLKTILGLPAPGVIVTAESVTKMNVASTSNGFTIGDNVATDTSDANGLFSFPLIRTVVMDDSTRALYRIIGKRDKKTKFIVDTLTVPPTGNVDISDKIGALY